MLRRPLLVVAIGALVLSASSAGLAQVILVVGDSAGNVAVRDLADTPLSAINLNSTAIGQIDVVDVDAGGVPEALFTHRDSLNLPTYCLELPSLTQRWMTDYPTRLRPWGGSAPHKFQGDFDGDGELDLLVPLQGDDANSTLYQVFSAASGHRECAFPELLNSLAVAYRDPLDSAWKLAGQKAPNSFTHYLYKYALANCPSAFECASTSVNMWTMGAIGSSMCDGQPRIWGGWYGRTLYVTDRNCNTLWSKSFGGSYEAQGTYAGDLCGDGVEALLIGGTYGTNHVRVDAAALCDGGTLWTFDDTDAHWALHVMAVEDVDGDGAKEVFVKTSGNESHPPKYQAIDGCDGARIWQHAYPLNTWMLDDARLADANGDGTKELLVIVNNTIEARNALTGALVRTYTFPANVTALDLATLPPQRRVGDLNCDGVVSFGDINPFVLALTAWGTYEHEYPDCDIMLADINGDGYVDFKDINPFVTLLTGQSCSTPAGQQCAVDYEVNNNLALIEHGPGECENTGTEPGPSLEFFNVNLPDTVAPGAEVTFTVEWNRCSDCGPNAVIYSSLIGDWAPADPLYVSGAYFTNCAHTAVDSVTFTAPTTPGRYRVRWMLCYAFDAVRNFCGEHDPGPSPDPGACPYIETSFTVCN